MTITAQGTRIGLVRAHFEDMPDLDLGTTGYLLAGLNDLFALEWMLEHPARRRERGPRVGVALCGVDVVTGVRA